MTTPDTTLCSSCGMSAAGQLVCEGCGVVQEIDRDPDFFTVFELPRRLVIDLADLEQRYYGLSRRLHPDLVHDRSAAERTASLKATALVNRAYRTLRDPVRRGLYWLSLHGESLGRDNERVPPELAALVFEVQERLEELRATRGADARAAHERAVRAAHDDLRVRLGAVERRLADIYERSDAAGAAGGGLLGETKQVLSELHYLRTLIRDVEKELEPEWSAS
jgi:molecular chaperone HscB